ncbi:MAG: ATP-dependent Clp protease adaptor ClpS [Phycisphaerae bacterium]|nr:ATP-dependent Clp protease adaptor ClpS [Tepidisphaeraceae bacterium]
MEQRDPNSGDGPGTRPKKSAKTKAHSRAGRAASKARRKRQPLPAYHVILLDDNDHTDVYVVEMLHKLFGHAPERGFEMARVVTTAGRVVVHTTHKELAELKRDQICAYGADPRIECSAGSMSAIIEPAQA